MLHDWDASIITYLESRRNDGSITWTGVNGSFLSISTDGLMVPLSVDFVTLSINLVENPKRQVATMCYALKWNRTVPDPENVLDVDVHCHIVRDAVM